MSEHVPCEHCEEVRLEAEDEAFGTALRSCLAEPEGTPNRVMAEQYLEDLFTPAPFVFPEDDATPVTFKLWSDIQ